MAGGFGQYFKDTGAELRHVAWPTRAQTITYAVLVALISVVVALYLGFFDFLFTSGMVQLLEVLPQASPVEVTPLVQGNPITLTPVVSSTTPQQ